MIGNGTVPLPYPKSPAFQNVRELTKIGSSIFLSFLLHLYRFAVLDFLDLLLSRRSLSNCVLICYLRIQAEIRIIEIGFKKFCDS
ncbi:hypothetical protein P8452_74846 [Trifolium repens]|nr:hypothetical protein P8452_74837 [Trifolium repens]WJX93300.1 hypothetical protein P8452_74842 [Trifolium repens]WJX93305.1 hypothetical protein P8452_74846 [Trifolium repens]